MGRLLSTLKKRTGILLLTVFFATVVNSAHAQQPASVPDSNSDDIRVRYIDGDNDVMYFNLKYINKSGNDFKLMVLNETGDVLFQSNYSGKRLKKNLKLPRLTDAGNITFLIRPARKNIQFSYSVKVTDKVVDTAPVIASNQLSL